MPYIDKYNDRREKLRNGDPALTAGELNYQIFYHVKHHDICSKYTTLKLKVIKGFVINFLGDKPNYQRYNDMTGALIRCSKEIERRLKIKYMTIFLKEIMESYDDEIAKYEDKKILENGDVE